VQAAVDVLRQFPPPPERSWTIGGLLRRLLHILVRPLVAAGRAEEAHQPALDAIQAYRHVAATAGADVAGVGSSLTAFSVELASGGLSTESVAAAQAAADL
jgi:hypothetical protein